MFRALALMTVIVTLAYGSGTALAKTLQQFKGNPYVDKTWVNCEGFGKPLFDGFGIDTGCRKL